MKRLTFCELIVKNSLSTFCFWWNIDIFLEEMYNFIMKTRTFFSIGIGLVLFFLLTFSGSEVSQAQISSLPKSGTLVSPAQPNIVGLTLANIQDDTGASALSARVAGFKSMGCDIDIGGTSATVQLECKLSGQPYRVVTGTSVTTSGIVSVSSNLMCDTVQSNVTACTNCSVTVFCEWAY